MSRHQKDPLRPLTVDERKELTRLSRSQSAPAAEVDRARALLAIAEGASYDGLRVVGHQAREHEHANDRNSELKHASSKEDVHQRCDDEADQAHDQERAEMTPKQGHPVKFSQVPAIAKDISGFCEGVGNQPPSFGDHTSSVEKQDRSMKHSQALEPLQDIASDPTRPTDTGPSLQRATVLFAASVSSFIGASLLLARI
jgi:hypothetical protein